MKQVTLEQVDEVRREMDDWGIYEILDALGYSDDEASEFIDEYEEDYGINGWDMLVCERDEDVIDLIFDYIIL